MKQAERLGAVLFSAAVVVMFLTMAVGADASERDESNASDTKIKIIKIPRPNAVGSDVQAQTPAVTDQESAPARRSQSSPPPRIKKIITHREGEKPEEPPIQIKSITLREEGKPARTVEIENVRPSVAPDALTTLSSADIRDLSGIWVIEQDSRAGRAPIQDRQIRMRSGGDGSFVAEFVNGTNCPTGSGQRKHYIKGNLSGNLLSGSIEVCPSAAFITKCGDESVYTTGFQAELRNANTIEGRYTATGYRIEAGGCVKDSSYDGDYTFLLERQETGTRVAALPEVANPQWDPAWACAPSPQLEERVVPGGGETPDSEVSGEPVNFNAYCLAKYGEGADALLLDKQDAYRWQCIGGSPLALHTIDVDRVCAFQNHTTTAALGDRCDPYSWSCTKLPVTLIYFRLDNFIRSGSGFLFFSEGDLELKIDMSVKLWSPRCSGLCEVWKYTIIDQEIGGPMIDHDIDSVHPFYLYDGSSLWAEIRGTEEDWLFDDTCYGSIVFRFHQLDDWGNERGILICHSNSDNPYNSFNDSVNYLNYEILVRD